MKKKSAAYLTKLRYILFNKFLHSLNNIRLI